MSSLHVHRSSIHAICRFFYASQDSSLGRKHDFLSAPYVYNKINQSERSELVAMHQPLWHKDVVLRWPFDQNGHEAARDEMTDSHPLTTDARRALLLWRPMYVWIDSDHRRFCYLSYAWMLALSRAKRDAQEREKPFPITTLAPLAILFLLEPFGRCHSQYKRSSCIYKMNRRGA